jgi:hypothetical protein
MTSNILYSYMHYWSFSSLVLEILCVVNFCLICNFHEEGGLDIFAHSHNKLRANIRGYICNRFYWCVIYSMLYIMKCTSNHNHLLSYFLVFQIHLRHNYNLQHIIHIYFDIQRMYSECYHHRFIWLYAESLVSVQLCKIPE